MLLLIYEAVNSLHLLFRPLMFRGTIDKEIVELKLYDVVYLQSLPIENHYFLIKVSFCVKSEGKCPVEVGC